jgi:hypothetical protein
MNWLIALQSGFESSMLPTVACKVPDNSIRERTLGNPEKLPTVAYKTRVRILSQYAGSQNSRNA